MNVGVVKRLVNSYVNLDIDDGVYRCMLRGFTGDQSEGEPRLLFSLPSQRAHKFRIYFNDRVLMITEIDEQFFVGILRFRGMKEVGDEMYLTFALLDTRQRSTGRYGFRVKHSEKCLVEQDDPSRPDGIYQLKSTMVDISESGVGLICPHRLSTDYDVRCIVTIADEEMILPCRVIYCNALAGETFTYRVGLNIMRTTADQQRKLSKYIRELQLRHIRSENGIGLPRRPE